MASDELFDEWIRTLDEDVIQDDYGYEDGEFTVYPEHWRPMFKEGLTPADAFKRALAARAASPPLPRRGKMREKRIIVGGGMGLAAAIATMAIVTPAEAQDITRSREPYKHGIKAKSTQKKRRKLRKGRNRL